MAVKCDILLIYNKEKYNARSENIKTLYWRRCNC